MCFWTASETINLIHPRTNFPRKITTSPDYLYSIHYNESFELLG